MKCSIGWGDGMRLMIWRYIIKSLRWLKFSLETSGTFVRVCLKQGCHPINSSMRWQIYCIWGGWPSMTRRKLKDGRSWNRHQVKTWWICIRMQYFKANNRLAYTRHPFSAKLSKWYRNVPNKKILLICLTWCCKKTVGQKPAGLHRTIHLAFLPSF